VIKVKKIVAVTLLAFLLALGGMAFSQQQGGMMAPQGGMMNMVGQCPMMGMINMMNQCTAMGGQQMTQIMNQCMAITGGRSGTPGSQGKDEAN
jgi:hypothetical protein